MSDEIEQALFGLDAERQLPPDMRARLEALIVERASGSEMPAPLRERISDAIARPEDALAGIDAPRELPVALRARLETLLGRSRFSPQLAQRILAAAAVVMLIAAGTFAYVRSGMPTRPGTTDTATGALPGADVNGASGSADIGSQNFILSPPISAPDGGIVVNGNFSSADAAADHGPPPPFTEPEVGFFAPQTESGPASAGESAAPQPTPAPSPVAFSSLELSVLRGDGDAGRGFDAYLAIANERGVRGYRLRATGAPSSIATVNLSNDALTDRRGTVFESFATPAASLQGSTFGFAGAAERQAHVIADAIFPKDSPGKTAVIYYESAGANAALYPDAIAALLDARHITSARVEVRPDRPVVLVLADAAFLALSPANARAWAKAAADENYHPTAGIASLPTLADESLASVLPNGSIVGSPYSLPAQGEERLAMQEGHVPMTARGVHGWVTAKMICYALWLSGAQNGNELAAAISQLRGFANGFAPAYAVRKGSNVRTPDAVLYRVKDGKLVPATAFITDTF